jgi:hypothetical protein
VNDLVLLVRQQWREAYRRLAEDGAIAEPVREQMESVTDELRRRIGSSYSLTELVAVYERSDTWAIGAIAEQSHGSRWIRTASAATDAAFHLYARGARDYAP